MANNCNKLMKEALDSFLGIDFRYKLDDTLEGLGSQKFTAKQLEGYLLGKGVSPKEIKQSGIFYGMIDDNRALPADMWLNKSGSQQVRPYLDTNFSDVTLGRKGLGNDSYQVTLSGVKAPSNNVPSEPHFRDTLPNIPKQSLLGWRRTHIDEINGKKTLVLNEFQSDWAQTERAGRGTFESNGNKIGLQEQLDKIMSREEYARLSSTPYKDLTDEQIYKIDEYDTLGENLDLDLVADFPMSEVKHHQFQIVGAINDAIKEGIDTVAIPIQRENELAGSKGVTKFYEGLNTKILPDIRKKLEKQGLKIKVDKKPYNGGQLDYSESFNRFINTELTQEERRDLGYLQDLATNHLETRGVENESIYDAIESANTLDDLLKALQPTSTNDLWTLTIEEVPNGKVKWDVYALLSSLGLGSAISQSEASTIATEKDIATRQISMEPGQKQQAIPEDKLDLASFLSEVPEVVKPSNYPSNYKGIKDYIAKIESRGSSNPYNAKNPNSSAKGKYQFTNIMVKDLNQKLGITRKDLKSPKVQEQVMEYLIGEYKEALDKWELPNTKENIFVLHNLGLTGGVKALRGTYEPSDIKNMASNLPADMDKSSMNAVITNYNTLYNVDIPLRSKRISKS